MRRGIISLIIAASALLGQLRAAVPGGEALAALILDEFDTNADGKVDSGEWEGGIKGSFDSMDANHDGSLAPGEADVLQGDIADKSGATAAVLVVALIKQVLLGLDKDGDGLVSRKEYEVLGTEMFARLDGDKDAMLSKAELAELPLKLLVK